MRDANKASQKEMSPLSPVVHPQSQNRLPSAFLLQDTLPEGAQTRQLPALAGPAGKLGTLVRPGQCGARPRMAEEKSVLLAAQSEAKIVALQIQLGDAGTGRYHGRWFQKMNDHDMKKRTQRTAVYVREPSWPPEDLSLAEQMKFIRKYARQRGLKIVRTFTDRES
jgi:hypothetical protein